MKKLTVLLLLGFAVGCNVPKAHVTKHPAFQEHGSDPNKLVWTDPADPRPVYSSNAIFGINLGRDGFTNGQPFYISGLYDAVIPRKLTKFESPLNLEIKIGGKPLSFISPKGYSQELNLLTGGLVTKWQATDGTNVTTSVTVRSGETDCIYDVAIVSPEARDVEFTLTTDLKKWESKVKAQAIKGVAASRTLCWDPSVQVDPFMDKKNYLTWTGQTWKAKSNGNSPVLFRVKINPTGPIGGLLDYAHLSECSLQIDGPIGDQQAVNSFVHYLSNSVANRHGPTGPFGLSNDKYGGRVFWDSDIWMFPALALLQPNVAQSIPRFRLDTRNEAEKAALDWVKQSAIKYEPYPGKTILKYPWEAGPDGRENAVGDSKKQDHITGSVAFSVGQAVALGLVDNEEAARLVGFCDQYYYARSKRGTDDVRGILQTMSPDEFASNVDNDLYTNLIAQWCGTHDHRYTPQPRSPKYKRPKDATTFLTYDGDKLRSYKQAAALLAIWPLQDPACEKEAQKMLDRFAGKATKNGPAMTQSVEALVRARFGDKELAYKEWQDSWQRYTQRPLMMFSEAPNGKNAYFLTGAAGCLDAFLYGFVGLRIDDHDPGVKPWKTPLMSGYWLSCEPHLPQAWKSVTISGLTVLGKRYKLVAQSDTVSATELGR